MKKQIVCGAIAIALTGLSTTVFSIAAPTFRARDNVSAPVAKEIIDRGRYVVKTSGCNDCHTPNYAETAGATEEKHWLTGSPVGWRGPWGTTYPINLRLFVQDLSEEQWMIVARKPARPPMPWFALRDMSDSDVRAIYHYVRSLGAAGEAAPEYAPPGKTVSTPLWSAPAAPAH